MRVRRLRFRWSMLAIGFCALLLVSCGSPTQAGETSPSRSAATASTTIVGPTSGSKGTPATDPSPSTQPVTTSPPETTLTIAGPRRAPPGPFAEAGV